MQGAQLLVKAMLVVQVTNIHHQVVVAVLVEEVVLGV
jgi:hypothetical protein